MDSRIIYTAEPESLWRRFLSAAERHGGVVHRDPPDIAIEVDDSRLYVTETEPDPEIPPDAVGLGDGLRMFVVDAHDLLHADRFLAEILEGVPAVVDDDQGHALASDEFIELIRSRP